MPGRPRCAERIPGYLRAGRVRKLQPESGSYGAAEGEAAWRGSASNGGGRRPGSQRVEESSGVGEGWARLMLGARK